MSKPLFAPTWSVQAPSQDRRWIEVLSSPAPFSLRHFSEVMENIVRHPELNSSIILRADILDEALPTSDGDISEAAARRPNPATGDLAKYIRRKILAKNPNDANLEQHCDVYSEAEGGGAWVVLTPVLDERLPEGEQAASIPFYHPRVRALAISYSAPVALHPSSPSGAEEGTIRLSVRPFSFDCSPVDQDSRLGRTALRLLSTVHKHGASKASEITYQKRVQHDKLVPREQFQDLYQEMKRRYLWLIKSWKEETDPQKHLFEDISIAAWLMCLWKDMYPTPDPLAPEKPGGRPPGGFVDVGCGNGLLVYILSNEGYRGYGFDLRARKSWELFRPLGADLRTASFSPSHLLSGDSAAGRFAEGCFFIGNHADELTPWIPVLTALTPGAASVNVPCCFHKLLGRFTEKDTKLNPDAVFAAFGIRAEGPEEVGQREEGRLHTREARKALKMKGQKLEEQARQLLEPGALESVVTRSELGGRYGAYMNYIAGLTLQCGFWPEHEALRIPSTKNLAIVARRRCQAKPGLSEEQVARSSARGKEEAEMLVRGVEGPGRSDLQRAKIIEGSKQIHRRPYDASDIV